MIPINVIHIEQNTCKFTLTKLHRKNRAAANRVDGLTGFFTDDVRLSHLSAEM